MNYRNPVFTGSGAIHCEIEHAELGWIPFTASPDDPQPHGAALYAEIIAAGGVAPWTPVVVGMPEQRQRMVDAINAERDHREETGFPYRGKVLDSTPRSVQRITAAALAAQAALAAGQSFQVDWTCADNSTLSLDAAGVISMPVALAQHAAALHAHARQLKAAVEATGTETELVAINIHTGWPGEPA